MRVLSPTYTVAGSKHFGRLLRRLDRIYFERFIDRMRDQLSHDAMGLNELRRRYEEYTSSVSSPDMAASWELISLLPILVLNISFEVCVDLGSGFTSYALRFLQKKTQRINKIISVDDSQEWLDKTFAYVKRYGLDTNNLLSTQDFMTLKGLSIGLLICDYSNFSRRADLVPKLTPFVTEKTLMLFDDFQPRDDTAQYRATVENWCGHMGYRLVSLRKLTLDEFGRFGVLAYHRTHGSLKRFLDHNLNRVAT